MNTELLQADCGKHRPQWHRQKYNTDVLEAVLANHLEGVKQSLRKGGSANATCREFKVTACHLAALNDSQEILECLKEEGANMNARAVDGCQPVHYAAWVGAKNALEFIIRTDKSFLKSKVEHAESNVYDEHLDSWTHRHADIKNKIPQNIKEGSTTTTLLSSQAIDETFIELLFALNNGSEQKKNRGTPYANRSILHSASFPAHDLTTNGLFEGVKIQGRSALSKIQVDDEEDSMKVALLQAMINQEDLRWVKYLLSEKGASPRAKLLSGNTPIHEAVLKKNLGILILLLESDPEAVNIQNSLGETPLHLAVKCKWSEGLDALLERHHDLSIQDADGSTVFHVACKEEAMDILLELLSCEDDFTGVLNLKDKEGKSCLFYATTQNSVEIVKVLCENNADTTWTGPKGENLLHVAITTNNSVLLKLFLKDDRCLRLINCKTNSSDGGRTPLHCAAMKGQLELVKALIEATKELNLVEQTGDKYEKSTALHLAARGGHVNVITCITAHDELTIVEEDGKDRHPLHVAILYLHKECARELILRGAGVCFAIKDRSKKVTALDLIMKHIPEPIDFLIETLDQYLKPIKGTASQPDCEVKIKFDFIVPTGNAEAVECMRQMDVLDTILNSGSSELLKRLLLHPVIEAFLFFKWNKLKHFFHCLFLLYIFLTISLTTFALYSHHYECPPLVLYVLRLLVIAFTGSAGLVEGISMLHHQHYYWKDPETWLKCTFLTLSMFIACIPDGVKWGRYPTSITVLLAWVLLLFLLSRFPNVGLIILMFMKVSENILQVMATFSFLLVGFTFAFFIHFGGTTPFSGLGEAFSKIIIMMAELDYVGAFEEDNEANPQDHEVAFIAVGRALYIFFLVLVVMVLTNLMVGLSVSDIAQLEKQGRSQEIAKKASFLSSLELIVYNNVLFSCLSFRLRRSLISLRAVDPSFILHPYNDSKNPFPKRLTDLVLDSTFKRRKKDS